MRRASGVPAGTQHGGGLRCTHRWFPPARPRFTTGYRPWCLRHPSTFMKCTTSLQQGCSKQRRSPQHTMRHQDLRKHRHAWQHSLGVVRQPGGLAACSRWSREAWRPIPPDHEVPRPHAPTSRRGCQPAAQPPSRELQPGAAFAAIPPGWSLEGAVKNAGAPVLSRFALNHRLQAVNPPGSKSPKLHDAKAS